VPCTDCANTEPAQPLSRSAAQHCKRILLLIAIALLASACAPDGEELAEILDRHFEVVAGDAYPRLVPRPTLSNPDACFALAARNLHHECTHNRLAPRRFVKTRVNDVDIFWATGNARVQADHAILLVTGDGSASAEINGEGSAAYAAGGRR
jgi:hypothetical protein